MAGLVWISDKNRRRVLETACIVKAKKKFLKIHTLSASMACAFARFNDMSASLAVVLLG
jgi:hypothetical protein